MGEVHVYPSPTKAPPRTISERGAALVPYYTCILTGSSCDTDKFWKELSLLLRCVATPGPQYRLMAALTNGIMDWSPLTFVCIISKYYGVKRP